MKIKELPLTLLFLGIIIPVIAQDYSQDSMKLINYQKHNLRLIRLMITPNLSSYKEIKDKIENDETYKVVLHEVSKSLEDKGFLVKDFTASLKISEEKYQLRENPNQDLFTILLENAPADIFVYVDISLTNSGSAKQVNIFLKAVDKYTADRYVSSTRLQSTKRYWNDFQAPALEALRINDALDEFTNRLQNELFTLIEFGRKIDLKFESTQPKKIGLQMMIEENKTLIDIINDWIKDHSISSIITIGNSNQILRKEVFIPFFSKNKCVYSPTDFGNELQKFLTSYLSQKKVITQQVIVNTIGGRVEVWFH